MGDTNVQVAVRCRPLNEREKAATRSAIVQCKPNTNEIAIAKRKSYIFDKVYGQYSTQKDVFKNTIKSVVDEALAGYNCTVFAYGQTGTGKTYTMQGNLSPDHEMAGIIPRAVRYIFDSLQANHHEYSVKVSFLQLYNEELKDLLAPDAKKLRLMEDIKRGGIYCQNLLEVTTTTASHVFELLETGVKNRITSETLMNEQSSRSHSIFTIRIHSKEPNPGGEDLLRIGQLNLVDLAGSECVGRSGARNARAREAGNINQSLLTLGRVITALVDNHPHIPYRDSKLTRLLQESLGGKAKTTIIATLAPCADSIDETMSTLEYAYRAKNIKNRPEMNQKMTKTGLLKEYGNEIESLRHALQAARAKDGVFLPPAQFTEMQERLASQSAQILELEDELETRTASCKEMEELIEKKEQICIQLEHEKEMIQKELKDTKQELKMTCEQLKMTDEELKMTQNMLIMYQQHEKTLVHYGQVATHLYEDKVEEADGLYSKLDRKIKIETMNEQLATEYGTEATTQLENLTERLTVHQQHHEQLCSKVEQAMVLMKQDHLSHIETLSSRMQLLENAIQQRWTALEKERKEEFEMHELNKKERIQAVNERERIMQTALDCTMEHMKEYTMLLTRQIQASTNRQMEHSKKIMTALKVSRDEMSTFLTEQSTALSTFEQSCRTSLITHKQELAQHHTTLVQAVQARQEKRQSELLLVQQQLVKMLEQSMAQDVQETKQEMEEMNEYAQAQVSTLEDLTNHVSEELLATSKRWTQVEMEQVEQFQAVTQELKTREENVICESKEDLQGIDRQQQTITKSINNAKEANTRTVSDEIGMFETHVAQQAQQAKQHYTSSDVFMNSTLQEDVLKPLMEGTQVMQTTIQEHMSGLQRKVEVIANDTTNAVKETRQMTCEQQEHVKVYLKKRRADTATGTTPKKIKPATFPTFELLNQSQHCEKATETMSETVKVADEPEDTTIMEEEQIEVHDPTPSLSPDPPILTLPIPIVSTGVRKRTLSNERSQKVIHQANHSSSLAQPKRYRVKKSPLVETTNKH